jgi:zinc/manganese transport system substrate-binding protein
MPRKTLLVASIVAGVAAGASGCGTAAGQKGGLQVVAAENVWGSLAAQLAGDRARVASVITSPATDPHDYEPTAVDARSFAGAKLVIVDGIGYDPWARKLLDANPVDGRIVLDVGRLLGIAPGGNPHRWYSPADVHRVIRAIAGDYAKLDPAHAAYFRRRQASLESHGLAAYHRLLATISRRYRGVPVGASESIFEPLAQALHLDLVTPGSFLKAVSEGTEPTAADETTIGRQIAQRQIEVWVYNSQNATPDVRRITEAARKRGIPVTTVTETPSPASASFQAWQVRQLRELAAALAQATRR